MRQLAHTDAELLTATFGPRTGLWLLLLAKGGGDATVSAEPWIPRSRSHVVTFPRDLTERAEMDSAVVDLARQALADVVAQSRIVTRVAVTVRTNTFYTRTKIRKLDRPTVDVEVITAAALRVLDLFELDRPVRLLGVRLELAPPSRDSARRDASRAARPQRPGEEHVDPAHRHAVGPPRQPFECVERADVRRGVDQVAVLGDPGQDLLGDLLRRSRHGRRTAPPTAAPWGARGRRRRSAPCPPAACRPRPAPPPTPRCRGGPGRSAAPPTVRAARYLLAL